MKTKLLLWLFIVLPTILFSQRYPIFEDDSSENGSKSLAHELGLAILMVGVLVGGVFLLIHVLSKFQSNKTSMQTPSVHSQNPLDPKYIPPSNHKHQAKKNDNSLVYYIFIGLGFLAIAYAMGGVALIFK